MGHLPVADLATGDRVVPGAKVCPLRAVSLWMMIPATWEAQLRSVDPSQLCVEYALLMASKCVMSTPDEPWFM